MRANHLENVNNYSNEEFNRRVMETQAAVLNELCRGDEGKILAWIQDGDHGKMLRDVVEAYLKENEEIDVKQLSTLVLAQASPGEYLH